LEVTTDGRHLTFLLVSLYEAGYGVQVFGSQFVFRELMLLRKTAPIPFLYGGKERECGISISDKFGFNHGGHGEHGGGKGVLLDYDYFSGLNKGGASHGGTANTEVAAGLRLASQASASEPDSLTSKLAQAPVSESLIRSADGPTSSLDTGHSPPATALRAPYFMHPSVYHRGLHKRKELGAERSKHVPCSATVQALEFGHTPPVTSYPPQRRRRFRIGFFGTHDREFYTQHYHFPGMNRCEILEVFLQNFGERITHLRGFPRDWEPCEIAVSIDGRGGDRQGKSFLSQDHYFEALRECDFVLSPPGICMPISHNLIEAMFCGAVPITNAGAFMAQPLENGKNCLSFSGETDFIAAIEKALAMREGCAGQMRNAVLDYYQQNLHPKAFVERLGMTAFDQIFVNAEEKSVHFVYPEFMWPPRNK
jgi:hypothetical protein